MLTTEETIYLQGFLGQDADMPGEYTERRQNHPVAQQLKAAGLIDLHKTNANREAELHLTGMAVRLIASGKLLDVSAQLAIAPRYPSRFAQQISHGARQTET